MFTFQFILDKISKENLKEDKDDLKHKNDGKLYCKREAKKNALRVLAIFFEFFRVFFGISSTKFKI